MLEYRGPSASAISQCSPRAKSKPENIKIHASGMAFLEKSPCCSFCGWSPIWNNVHVASYGVAKVSLGRRTSRLDASGTKRTPTTQAARRTLSRKAAVKVAAFQHSADVSKTFTQLQNGSDIRGIAIEGVEGETRNLTPKIAYYIGSGLARLLSDRFGKPTEQLKVSIGRDPRLSGAALQAGLTAGLTSQGVSVAQFGLATTPAMFMSCVIGGTKFDGAVMITASHLPYNRNGFKFFDSKAGFEKKEISDLLQRAAAAAAEGDLSEDDSFPRDKRQAEDAEVQKLAESFESDVSLISKVDFMPVYAAHLRDIIRKGVNSQKDYDRPLAGFKIAVDAGNGSGGFLAEDVLSKLGADTSGSQFLEPDGTFPNHSPNPENKEAMKAGVEAVRRSAADLGIVVDTDVDRSAVVASSGEAINSNRYIALMSYITLRKYPGSTIVTDSVTSNGLGAFITKLGGKHFRYKRGYKNVIGKGMELNEQGVDCHLMMETSGHGAMKENYYLDDGTYSASQIVVEMVRRRLEGEGDISEDLLSQLSEPADSREFRLKLKQGSFKEDGQKVLDSFRGWVEAGACGASGWHLESENHEGWRVAVDEGEGRQGWLLLRSSLHDPLLVLNAESDIENGVKGIVDHIVQFFESEVKDVSVDISKLKQL